MKIAYKKLLLHMIWLIQYLIIFKRSATPLFILLSLFLIFKNTDSIELHRCEVLLIHFLVEHLHFQLRNFRSILAHQTIWSFVFTTFIRIVLGIFSKWRLFPSQFIWEGFVLLPSLASWLCWPVLAWLWPCLLFLAIHHLLSDCIYKMRN